MFNAAFAQWQGFRTLPLKMKKAAGVASGLDRRFKRIA